MDVFGKVGAARVGCTAMTFQKVVLREGAAVVAKLREMLLGLGCALVVRPGHRRGTTGRPRLRDDGTPYPPDNKVIIVKLHGTTSGCGEKPGVAQATTVAQRAAAASPWRRVCRWLDRARGKQQRLS